MWVRRRVQATGPRGQHRYTISGWLKRLPSLELPPPTTGMSESSGIDRRSTLPSVGRVCANWESKMSAVIPSAASVMAIPTTIWSRPKRTQSTTMITETSAPATAPARNPSQVDPP